MKNYSFRLPTMIMLVIGTLVAGLVGLAHGQLNCETRRCVEITKNIQGGRNLHCRLFYEMSMKVFVGSAYSEQFTATEDEGKSPKKFVGNYGRESKGGKPAVLEEDGHFFQCQGKSDCDPQLIDPVSGTVTVYGPMFEAKFFTKCEAGS